MPHGVFVTNTIPTKEKATEVAAGYMADNPTKVEIKQENGTWTVTATFPEKPKT